MRQLISRTLCVVAVLALGVRTALAQEAANTEEDFELRKTGEKAQADTTTDFVRFAFNFYEQTDGGGNENLDEDMTVVEPMILFSKALSEKWTVTFKGQSDIISAASIEKGTRFPPGTQSGASGDKFFGADVGAFYAWSDQTLIGGGLSLGTEYDYNSTGAYFSLSHDTPDHNDTFVLKTSAFFDSLDIIKFDGSEDGSDTRQSFSTGFGWSHVIGPKTVGTLNWDLTLQNGFLSTPYNSVVVGNTEVEEVLPDSRVRNALHARVRHLLAEDVSIEPGVGVYFDDWGARALNFEFAAYWEAMPARLIIRPTYRFHQQSEVDDFISENATAIPEFRTQDSDLASFHSHTLGLKFFFPDIRWFGDPAEIEIGADYSLRSDDLNSFSFTLGYQWRF